MQKKGIIKPKIKKSTVQKVRDKAKITTITIPPIASVKEANRLVAKAGKVIKQSRPELENCTHVGSMVVHIYQDRSEFRPVFASNILFQDDAQPAETYAGLALDELKRKAMAHFGRKPTGGH